MRETVRSAGRATYGLLAATGLALVSYVFLGLILFTGVLTLTVIGAGVLPETVLLLRRLAGVKRHQVAARTGEEIPEAYLPLTGPLTERARTALSDPGTWRDLRWLTVHLVYAVFLFCFALNLWAVALLVDGVWCALLGQRAVLLPLIERLADLDMVWSRALLLRIAERPARRAGGGADRNEGGRHRRARRRATPHRAGSARRGTGAPGGAVDAAGPCAAGVRP